MRRFLRASVRRLLQYLILPVVIFVAIACIRWPLALTVAVALAILIWRVSTRLETALGERRRNPLPAAPSFSWVQPRAHTRARRFGWTTSTTRPAQPPPRRPAWGTRPNEPTQQRRSGDRSGHGGHNTRFAQFDDDEDDGVVHAEPHEVRNDEHFEDDRHQARWQDDDTQSWTKLFEGTEWIDSSSRPPPSMFSDDPENPIYNRDHV